MKCTFQSGIIFLHRKGVENMALYEIKNYIKLLCIRIDHIESYVVDELNTSDEQKINEFINTNKLVVVNDDESPDALQTDSYLHRLLDLGK